MASHRETVTKADDASHTHGVEARFARAGKLSYLQIPAEDPDRSADFYARVFSWEVSGSSNHRSFKDACGELLGAFVRDREVAREPGLLPYIYVDDIDAALARIVDAGGVVQAQPTPQGELWTATFRDPAGNVIGVWQAGARRDHAD